MTAEDEAFVRRIVDSPGDDTPRLVYADWLDERGDPRGAYLRTELELVTSDDIGGLYAHRLAALAADTDPLWIARVSRPPAGVCCDHLRFTDRGPVLTLVQIRASADRLGTTFPPDVVALLANYNGGIPEPSVFSPDVPHLRRVERRQDLAVGRFLPLTRTRTAAEHWADAIETYMPVLHNAEASRAADRQPWVGGERLFLPIAMANELGSVGVGLSGRRTDGVYFINRPTLGTASPPRKVADSLPDFLNWIR